MSVVPALSIPFSREKLLQIARGLPADLQVLSALGEMLQDINSELDEIAGLLRRDVALAARIVRISNSPFFGGGSRIGSVEEAVNRVGFGEILKLVGTATAARLTERALEHYDVSAEALRDNMLYTALAAEALARRAGSDDRAAYTAGLMRPLGMMVLDRAGRGALLDSQRFTLAHWSSYAAWEGTLFGINNCEITAMILQEWRFPVELSAAIRSHYLARASDLESQLGSILNIANGLAQRRNRVLLGESCYWESSPNKLSAAGVTEEDLEDVSELAEISFDAAVAALAA